SIFDAAVYHVGWQRPFWKKGAIILSISRMRARGTHNEASDWLTEAPECSGCGRAHRPDWQQGNLAQPVHHWRYPGRADWTSPAASDRRAGREELAEHQRERSLGQGEQGARAEDQEHLSRLLRMGALRRAHIWLKPRT